MAPVPPLTEKEPEIAPAVAAPAKDKAPTGVPLGLALSGGGVRAALFSLGVIIGLIEAKCYGRVRCIASVSGGSILNAALAHAGKEGGFQTVDEFEPLAKRLAKRLASQGVFAFDWRTVLSALWYVVQVIARAFFPVLISLAMIADQMSDNFKSNLANFDYSRVPWQLVGWVVLGSIVLSILFSRGLLQELKFSSVLGAVDDKTPKGGLSVSNWGKTSDGTSTGVMHVLVATDLLSGEPMYFSSSFVHCRSYGWSTPEDLGTAEALYSSAAFPAVFPPKRLRLGRLKFQNGEMQGALPHFVRLADGGVYNNLGTDWFDVLREQLRTERPLLWPFGEVDVEKLRIDDDNIIIVNASAPSRRVRFLPPFPVSRIMSVLYDNTVRPRVQTMQDKNRPLIDIDESPFELAKRLTKLGGDAGALAQGVAQKLQGVTDGFWADFKRETAGTRTKLTRAGRRESARLMLHGYLSTLVLMRVRFGAELNAPIRGEKYFLKLVPRPWRMFANGTGETKDTKAPPSN